MRILMAFLVAALGNTVVSAETVENLDVYEVTAESVFVRKAPGKYSNDLGVIKKGDHVPIIYKGKKWLEVKLPSGKTGYVFHRFLKKVEISQEFPPQQAKSEPITQKKTLLPDKPASTTITDKMQQTVASSECDANKLKDELATKDVEIDQLKRYVSKLIKEKEAATPEIKNSTISQDNDRELLLTLVDEKGEKVYLRGVGEALVYSHEGISVLRVPQSLKNRADAAMAFVRSEEISHNNFVYYLAPSAVFSR